MKMAKKVLGVVLALAMLVNVFAIFSFAAAPDSAVDLALRTDKDSYKAGDTVKITISEKVVAEVGLVRIGCALPIGYDSSKIQFPKTDVYDNCASNFGVVAHQAGYDDGGSTITWTDGLVTMGDTIDDGYNWDSVVLLTLPDDGMTTYEAFNEVDMFTFEMVIAEDCPDGDIVVGLNAGSFMNYSGYVNDNANGGIYGWDDDYGYGTTANYNVGTVTIHVGEAKEPSILQYSKAQIRFAGIGATSTSADYKGTFDVRTIAKISQADFLATFTSEENAIAKISDIGFVYATTSNVAAFDADTAKAVAEGGSAANYVKAPVTRIQHTGDGEDYIFTCLITNIDDADKTDGVGCLAYVCFDGEYIYFDAPVTVSYNTLYTTYMPA